MQAEQGVVLCDRCGAECPLPPPSGGAAGYALIDSERVCYACADEQQRADIASSDVFSAYVSSDGSTLQAWTGGRLGSTTIRERNQRSSFGDPMLSVWATDIHGGRWFGIGLGRGMLVNLRRRA